MDIRQKLYELTNQRSGLLQEAENALTANNQADYTAAMDKIANINKDIQDIRTWWPSRTARFSTPRPPPAVRPRTWPTSGPLHCCVVTL